MWNSAVAILGMLLLGAVSLPFWLFPPLWPVIPVVILAWVTQRVLRYASLAEHADSAEMTRIFSECRGTLLVLGRGVRPCSYVPVVGICAPVLVALTFIHYLLERLQRLRNSPPAS